jgi:hypothetical protein
MALSGDRLSRSFVLATNRLAGQIDPRRDAALIIPSPKKRFDVAFSDIEGCRVRKRAFQAITNLDKHLAILDEHKEHDPVATFFLADAPRLRDALRIVRDIRVALHLGKNRYHDLIGSFPLELRKLFVKSLGGFI